MVARSNGGMCAMGTFHEAFGNSVRQIVPAFNVTAAEFQPSI
jgi:hypothetical protein